MRTQDERSIQESEAPPAYDETLSCPTTSSRYGSLPSTMSVHGQWTKWKSMNLCGGSNAKDRLCLIEMQTGYSGKAPLGMRTGFFLRNGMSTKDPLLAAAGDESRGLHAFNPDGIVFLPPLDPEPKSDRMDTELLRAEPGTNNDIAFHFSIEIMDSGSELYEKTGGNASTEILQPAVLFLSGQSVFAESTTPIPLYQLNSDIRSISNKDSSVAFERVEQDISDSETEIEGVTPGTRRKRHLFYLAHPVNAQYRTDIPAKYYITSAVPEMVGNIRLEDSEARFQKTSFKAMLSAKRTASDKPLFYDGSQQLLLFNIQPNWKVSRNCYKWSDSNGRQVAVEEKEDDRYKLSVTSSMSQELRDALVATWLLRLWHETAESKQAKREFFESMASSEECKEYMPRQCIMM
ncbi:hypothetical protein N7527_002240 [Penicillium freii]|nr:hypothetical protein N7527_002240 [Penicillium freii]